MLLPALLLIPLAVPTAQDDELPDGNKLVSVSILADRDALAPGGSATLLVRLSIEDKWHVYWENPGDSGIPTRFEWKLPAGFEVGPPRFPWPKRHVDPGDIVTYVHEGRLDVLFELRASPDAAPAASADIAVEASWLVCKEICVPGSGRASLALAVLADAPAAPARAEPFAASRARLPRPWSELRGARANWAGDEAEPRLSLIVPGAKEIELFPLDSAPTKFIGRSVRAGGDGASLKAELEFKRKRETEVPRLRGVVWVRTEQGEASYLLETTRPEPR
jgi:thiol:disulfide interchange protein DsbD